MCDFEQRIALRSTINTQRKQYCSHPQRTAVIGQLNFISLPCLLVGLPRTCSQPNTYAPIQGSQANWPIYLALDLHVSILPLVPNHSMAHNKNYAVFNCRNHFYNQTLRI